MGPIHSITVDPRDPSTKRSFSNRCGWFVCGSMGPTFYWQSTLFDRHIDLDHVHLSSKKFRVAAFSELIGGETFTLVWIDKNYCPSVEFSAHIIATRKFVWVDTTLANWLPINNRCAVFRQTGDCAYSSVLILAFQIYGNTWQSLT